MNRRVDSGGGWQAIRYAWRKARESGGIWRFYRALRSKNSCKTCAVGMGGQKGGMINEAGRFPEVCKKAMQAMAADMQPGITAEFFAKKSIDQLQDMTPRELEAAGRLTMPLLYTRGESHYRPISWEEACERISDRLKSLSAHETFWYFSGRSSNEAGFLLQLFARLYGTNNVNNCSYYCHQASGVGLSTVLGTGTATLQLDDVEHADLVFVIGGNPASNHPRIMTTLKNIRRRGGEVIVINPVRETGMIRFRVPSDWRSLFFGTAIASQYIQPHIGGDLALLTGIAKRILEMGKIERVILEEHCEGWPELRQLLENTSWDEIGNKSGVAQAEIDRVAASYARARNVVFSWTMGITHHTHGVQNVQLIAALALMRGMVGRPHAGLLPIRGHSNVQGIGSMGVTPQLKQAIFDYLQHDRGLTLPSRAGLDTLGCMEEAAAGRLRLGFALGGNLYGSNPDAAFAADALGKLGTMVYLNTTLNTGHAHGLAKETLILPVRARDEEPQRTTQESMFNFVRLSDGGPPRHAGPRSEIAIIAQLAQSVLGTGSGIDWQQLRDAEHIRELIAEAVPGYGAIGSIAKQDGQEFQIDGRTFHEPHFATPSGKANLHTFSLPELNGTGQELRLMTVRSEGQFNTVVYEEEGLYRGQTARDIILLHPDDIAARGLLAGERVTVKSNTGAIEHIEVVAYDDIRAGNALMYYPEANVLVPRTADPASKTPAFKGFPVSLHAEAAQVHSQAVVG